jgi:hypothetical protein
MRRRALGTLGILLICVAAMSAAEPSARSFVTLDEISEANEIRTSLLLVDEAIPSVHRRYGAPAFEATPLGEPIVLTSEQQRRFVEVLKLNADRTPEFVPSGACIFHPDISVKFVGAAKNHIECVICFSCGEMIILREGYIPDEIAVGYAHRELVGFFQACFPKDPRWEKLIAQENRVPESLGVIEIEAPEGSSTK